MERIGCPNNFLVIAIQLFVGLALLIFGAKGFIYGVEEASSVLGISALILSMLIIPIATELPEKVNSIFWIRKGKDTLAFGNITGAMVFQGTLLPAIGILLTPWEPRQEVYLCILITLISSLWIRALIQKSNIKVWHLGINGIFYSLYLYFALH
jgi:cation:H+ antiporter